MKELKTAKRGLSLAPRKIAFIAAYVDLGDTVKAAIVAGYSERSAAQQGGKLRRELQDQIFEAAKIEPSRLAPQALAVIRDLMQNAERESVKLDAAKYLLDRSLGKTAQVVEMSVRGAEQTIPELIQEMYDQVGAFLTAEILRHQEIPVPKEIQEEIERKDGPLPSEDNPEGQDGPHN